MSNYLFIDDSGSKEWRTPYSRDFIDNPPARTKQNLDFWRGNYFVLAGIHITSDLMATLNPLINKKKLEVFGTQYVELHSSNLRNPYQIRKQYLDKYHITNDMLREFIDNFWYPLFENNPIQIIAIIVDKRYFKNFRHIDGKTPLEIASEALFDRTELHPHKDCNIVFDQMDDHIKSAKRDQGKVFEISNTKINLADGKYKNKYSHTSVSFESSANSNFLQLADMVAYNVWRQFVDYGDEWDNHSPIGEHRKLPTYPYFERVSQNFYHSDKNMLNGWGIVKLPDPHNNWLKGWNLNVDDSKNHL